MWGGNGICMDNITYVGTSFFERRGQNEVGMYICDVQMKLNGVTWNCCDGSYEIR